MDEVCGLFKLAGMSDDVIKRKFFPLSLKGDTLTWYMQCDDMGSWNCNRLKLEFHHKFYHMHLVHRHRNYIYNVRPCEGESIAQAFGTFMLGFLVMINPCSILLVLVFYEEFY